MKLYFVTTNEHKVEEVSHVLEPYGIAVEQVHQELAEPDVGSQEKVALYKAEQAYARLKKPVIVEDTGVYFKAYHDFPGIFAKRIYLGIGFKGLLKLLKGEDRRAMFKVVIVLQWGKRKHQRKLFVGTLRGRMGSKLKKPHSKRLAYEKLFIPAGYSKAIVEMPLSEKNKFSHRAVATHKLARWLKRHPLGSLR